MRQVRCISNATLLCSCLATGIAGQVLRPEQPRIIAVEPQSGLTTPGSKLKIYGTSFTAETIVYFDGLEARDVRFVGPSALEVVTPYLRPGRHQLQLKSRTEVVQSDVAFSSEAAPVDLEIDRAAELARKGEQDSSIALLISIGKTHPDYQVRAFAHYQAAEVYFAKGDWWRWAGEAAAVFDSGSGRAVQTCWRYRIASDEADYFLPTSNEPDHDLKLADWTVQFDVTQNPEPRFFRALVNARYGNLEKAKGDSDFVLRQEPENPAYRALAAYVGVLGGDKARLRMFLGETITDPRALRLLGEAVYLNGDIPGAAERWGQAAKISPTTGDLACWAGKKHLAQGQRQVAQALLAECAASSPVHEHVTEANDLLVSSQSAPPK